MSATWDGSAVHTWHSAPMSMRTDSACATSIGSSGHRRIGRVSPTCTGIDKIARMAAGSSTDVAGRDLEDHRTRAGVRRRGTHA